MYNFVLWREDNLKKFLEEDGAEGARKCLLRKSICKHRALGKALNLIVTVYVCLSQLCLLTICISYEVTFLMIYERKDGDFLF